MKRLLLLVVLSLLTNSFAAPETSDIKQLREYFRKAPGGPYTYLQTPRTGLGVGTVYTVVEGGHLFYSRPEDCFTKEFLARANDPGDKVVIRDIAVTGKYAWQLGLGVANAGPITEDVKADFQRSHVSTMTLTVGPLKRALITIRDLKEAIRSQVDLDCKSILSSSKPERWIILETLYTDQFALEFQDTNGTNVGVSAKVIKILFPSFKSSKEETLKGALKFSGENYIVAIKAIKIGEPTKYSAGDLEYEEVNPDEYYKIVSLSERRGNIRSPGD